MAKIMMSNDINIIKEETCKIGKITLRSDKIIMFKPFDGVTTINMENAKEMYSILMNITEKVPHLYYSDNTNLKSLGAEERVYMTGKIHHFASKMAIKENSAIVRFITHSMVYLNKPPIALKMFKTEKEAINWLKS
jgi:hypothetical protein